MSVNLPSHYAKQFANSIELLSQQKGSRLINAVMTGQHVGEAASPVDQIGSVEVQTPAGRFAPMNRVDAAVDRRWVFPEDYELAQMIDSFDKLRLLNDPSSSYLQNAVNALGRKWDRQILAAINGTNYTGKAGGTSTSLPNAQKVAVDHGAAASVGLTVAKLRRAKKIIMGGDVDLDNDPLYCAISDDQHDDLLAEAQVISLDYNDRPVLVEGRIMRFLGINFIHTQLIEANSTSDLVPVWAKSGVYLGKFGSPFTKVSERDDLSGCPWQAYMRATSGATRLEEAKVVQIACLQQS